MPRSYMLKQRAAQMEDTRRRITEAAVALHGSAGPARTTISAIAEQAGVERATVYRHFPDEDAIFAACSAHWIAANPPPDPAGWTEVDGPARLHRALRELYAYYGRTRQMWQLNYRDVSHVPALAAPFSGWLAFLDQVVARVAECWPSRGAARHRVKAAIRHAIDFRTWDQLTTYGLDDGAIIGLLDGMVRAAEPGATSGTRDPSRRRPRVDT